MPLPRILVIAKAPEPGRSKTRLCPPCTLEQAAELAEAALVDTLEAVAGTDCQGRTLVLDGQARDWLPEGFHVVQQVEGTLGQRLAGAFESVDGPAFLIGMDTPQITPELLEASLVRLLEGGDDAVLGLCEDGGYWGIGMKQAPVGVFDEVPMSTERTGQVQLERLREFGLSVGLLSGLRDVDFFEDAQQVAAICPSGRFAAAVRKTEETLCLS